MMFDDMDENTLMFWVAHACLEEVREGVGCEHLHREPPSLEVNKTIRVHNNYTENLRSTGQITGLHQHCAWKMTSTCQLHGSGGYSLFTNSPQLRCNG